MGIDKGEIPDLTKAPSSLLEALEQHLATLEGRKLNSTSKQNSVDVSSFSNTQTAFIASDEKQKILAEEEAALNQFKEQKAGMFICRMLRVRGRKYVSNNNLRI